MGTLSPRCEPTAAHSPVWRSGDARPLRPGDVHVWRFATDAADDRLEAMMLLLTRDEQQRADRFRAPRDRASFIARRAWRRRILARYTGTSPRELRLLAGAFGKPALAAPHGPLMQFNASHSDGIGLLALALNREVGIDIERRRPDVDYDAIAKRFFAPQEVTQLLDTPEAERGQLFFTLWTCKEAWVKARGAGLSWPLARCPIVVSGVGDARLQSDPQLPKEAERWSLRTFTCGDEYAAALVTPGEMAATTFYDVPDSALLPGRM